MRLVILVLPLFLSTCLAIPGGGLYNSVSSTFTKVKNGIAYYMPKLGSCPDMPAQKNLAEDVDDLLGFWYVMSALNHEVLQGKARYMSANVLYDEANKELTFKLQQMNEASHQWGYLTATAKVLNGSLDEFKFAAKFKLPLYGSVGGTFTLIRSDFKTYAVVHGCGSFWNILYYDVIWLVARDQVLSPKGQESFNRKTREVLNEFRFIDQSKFIKIHQINTEDPDD